MKIMAEIDGEKLCIQVVKRGETVYIRRCAYTMFQPTERQYAVRRNVALASIAEYDEAEAKREHLTRDDINNAVREAFEKWHITTRKKSDIEELLKSYYGPQVENIKETYKNLNKN